MENIYIDNNLTVAERSIQKKIRETAEEYKQINEHIKIGYQKSLFVKKVRKWRKNYLKPSRK